MLEGKIAVVTGAGSGLGEAIALRFAQSGATVVLADLDVAGAEHALGEIKRAGGQGQVLKTDVSKADSAKTLVGLVNAGDTPRRSMASSDSPRPRRSNMRHAGSG